MSAKQQVNGKSRLPARERGPREKLRGVAVEIAPGIVLHGDFGASAPGRSRGAVVVVHASRLPPLEPRNRVLLAALAEVGLDAMLLDLFTVHEKVSAHLPSSDLEALSDRIVAATRWLHRHPELARSRLGVLGMDSSAAPALLAAAKLGDRAGAAVAWGGGAELMDAHADDIVVPVLLIVDGHAADLEREYELRRRLQCPTSVAIVPGVTHEFAQRGPVQRGAQQAADWLAAHLATSVAAGGTDAGPAPHELLAAMEALPQQADKVRPGAGNGVPMDLGSQPLIENRTFEDIEVGESAALERRLTWEDIELFAVMSGDVNPAHVDEEYARSDRFHGIVAHGMWGASLISTLLGTRLPGPGTIYLEQTLRFRHPVSIGDTITVSVVVASKAPHHRVALDCRCVNQHGETVIDGTAKVIAPTEKVRRRRFALPEVSLREPGVGHAPPLVA